MEAAFIHIHITFLMTYRLIYVKKEIDILLSVRYERVIKFG